ncbi:DUF4241 domain-containing protein [Oryzobacter terrae]|uniref:DUF4241 domain-containing protein n=1 Tax=Oryzobacter terrae TaxID=1620385 RepID=UPI003673428F
MFEVGDVRAGVTGRVAGGGREYDLTTVDLGVLVVPSGVLGATDPFVRLDDPLTTSVPPGSYPVHLTIADVSEALDGSHLREAYLTLRVADGIPVRLEVVAPDGAAPPDDPDAFYGVPVDTATVAFVDAAAVTSGMPPQDPPGTGGSGWYDDLFEPDEGGGWFGLMDDPSHLRAGSANIALPLATNGENVVLTHSGWGDGLYPLLRTYDEAGVLLEVHVDLMVVPPEGLDLTS